MHVSALFVPTNPCMSPGVEVRHPVEQKDNNGGMLWPLHFDADASEKHESR